MFVINRFVIKDMLVDKVENEYRICTFIDTDLDTAISSQV